ncbi:MAG: acetyl-CoA hydrolase [Xanthomonadales bacterium]|nr:acetyl-CoA hydrolase [Xanthomonadales bacterium]
MTEHFEQSDACVDWIIDRLGTRIVCATPLGLGKPNALLNALYRRARERPEIELKIYTALSLARPQPASELEQRFLGPFLERHFGADYPDLDWIEDLLKDRLPPNIDIHEFYVQSGMWLYRPAMQRRYTSLNYTHVAQVVSEAGVNLLLQMVARRDGDNGARYSLSCNPDVTFDAIELAAQRPLMVGAVHPQLPFMPNDAEVGEGFFDAIVPVPEPAHRLFGLPRQPVEPAEFAMGIHAASLIRDGGTLQIGIGALSDALVHATLLRHRDNAAYRQVLDSLDPSPEQQRVIERWGGTGALDEGLYGASEMVMDGFMHLVEGGVLSRRVFPHLGVEKLRARGLLGDVADAETFDRLLEVGAIDLPLHGTELRRLQRLGLIEAGARIEQGCIVFEDGGRLDAELSGPAERRVLGQRMAGRALQGGLYLQGAFFLGSQGLYDWLNGLDEPRRAGIGMTRVTHINELPTGSTALAVVQRRHARFFNTCMMQTLLGAAVSDALDNGQVVSGVGGQYNFVAMGHRLADGRSVLMLRATRMGRLGLQSNIVWNYGYTTIPRHLRDLVVTEYGVADLKGKSDEECIQALICIADARFQSGLLAQARLEGKVDPAWEIPPRARHNTPAHLQQALAVAGADKFPRFPFGSDLQPLELHLAKSLRALKRQMSNWPGRLAAIGMLLRGGRSDKAREGLERLGLAKPKGLKQKLLARLVGAALCEQ